MSLIVSHLHKKYGEKTVVDDLSFAMEKPGVYALLGTNGAGKTTTIRMMLGMLARDGGEVLWNGKPLSTETVNICLLYTSPAGRHGRRFTADHQPDRTRRLFAVCLPGSANREGLRRYSRRYIYL